MVAWFVDRCPLEKSASLTALATTALVAIVGVVDYLDKEPDLFGGT